MDRDNDANEYVIINNFLPPCFRLFFSLFRFFCNDAAMLDSRAKEKGGDLTEDAEQDCQKQEGKHVAEDVSSFSETEKSSRTVFTSLGEMQKSCSQWYSSLRSNSGNLGLPHTVFSQQFHQQRNNCIVSQEDQINVAVCNELEEESSPLIELEQTSQSPGSCEPSECSLESSEILQVSNNSLGAKVRKLDTVSAFVFTLNYKRNYSVMSPFQNGALQMM